jgi:hypothetical protein
VTEVTCPLRLPVRISPLAAGGADGEGERSGEGAAEGDGVTMALGAVPVDVAQALAVHALITTSAAARLREVS